MLFSLAIELAFSVTQARSAFPPQSGPTILTDTPAGYGSIETDLAVLQGTGLRLAAREGRLREIRRLLSIGTAVDAAGEYGETALMAAARFNQIKAAEELLAQGASGDARDYRDETPLMKASMNCSHRITRAILENRANANLTNHEGRSALHFASINGCVHIVTQLLRTPGIDPNLVDDGGKTALDYALEESQVEVGGPYTDIARTILAAGGRAKTFVVPTTEHSPAKVLP